MMAMEPRRMVGSMESASGARRTALRLWCSRAPISGL